MQQILEELRRFVVSNFLFGQEDDRLGDDTSFMESGIIDSTGVLELVQFVEQQYGIQVEDEDLIPENLDSLSNLAKYVSAKQG